jgi:hypothetical protein
MVIFLQAVLVTLGLFVLKKRRGENRSAYDAGGFGPGRQRPQRLGSTDHILAPQYSRPFGGDQALNAFRYPAPNSATAPSPATLTFSGQYEPRPFNLPSSSNLHSRSSSRTGSGSPFADGELSQAGRRKAGLADVPAYKPSRFILHTDVEEAVPVEEEDIVELPPQYTDRRPPPSDLERRPSNIVDQHPSNGVRRRPSGNVPLQDIPPILPNLPSTSPPGGRSWF